MAYKIKIKQIDLDGLGGAGLIFDTDLTVSLSNGKTFGKYTNGQVIPSTGKTANEVIQMAVVEALAPTVSLTSSSTVQFNQTAVSIVLNYSTTINSLGASLLSSSIEWRRGNSGSWTVLTTLGNTSGSYTHTFTDTAFNTASINYRYIVTDTATGTNTATLNFTPVYVAPSISLTVTGSSVTSPESNSNREKGNVSSSLSGTITRNSSLVDLSTYTLQYQVNGTGGWTDIGSATSIGPGTTSFGPIVHNNTGLTASNSISYRVSVVDTYQTTTGGNSTVNFGYLIFYGPSSSAPTNSAGVRALGTKIFTTGANPFNLETGTTQRIFTAAMPATLSLSAAIDLDALNVDIKAQYILSTFNVNDAGGTAVSYKVYTMTNSIPYSLGGTPPGNHRHQITRS
jgi:hypothetical protein